MTMTMPDFSAAAPTTQLTDYTTSSNSTPTTGTTIGATLAMSPTPRASGATLTTIKVQRVNLPFYSGDVPSTPDMAAEDFILWDSYDLTRTSSTKGNSSRRASYVPTDYGTSLQLNMVGLDPRGSDSLHNFKSERADFSSPTEHQVQQVASNLAVPLTWSRVGATSTTTVFTNGASLDRSSRETWTTNTSSQSVQRDYQLQRVAHVFGVILHRNRRERTSGLVPTLSGARAELSPTSSLPGMPADSASTPVTHGFGTAFTTPPTMGMSHSTLAANANTSKRVQITSPREW